MLHWLVSYQVWEGKSQGVKEHLGFSCFMASVYFRRISFLSVTSCFFRTGLSNLIRKFFGFHRSICSQQSGA